MKFMEFTLEEFNKKYSEILNNIKNIQIPNNYINKNIGKISLKVIKSFSKISSSKESSLDRFIFQEQVAKFSSVALGRINGVIRKFEADDLQAKLEVDKNLVKQYLDYLKVIKSIYSKLMHCLVPDYQIFLDFLNLFKNPSSTPMKDILTFNFDRNAPKKSSYFSYCNIF